MNRSLTRMAYLTGLTAAAIALVPACGANKSPSTFTNDAGTTQPTGGSDSGMTLGGDASGSMLGGDGSQANGNCSGMRCSSDLRSLVDCNGNVLMTCPANQGCAGTTCVPGCQSAIANQSSLGCDYYAVDPDVQPGIGGGSGGCFVAYIANTWDTPVTVTVDYGGMSLDASTFAYAPVGTGRNISFTPLNAATIPTGQVGVLFLSDVPGATDIVAPLTCPSSVHTAITTFDAATHGTGLGKAFHIAVSAPVAAFDIYPYGGGAAALTSATLLLPTSAWDTNYVAVTGYGPGAGIPPAFGTFPFVEVVAQKDNTNVVVNPVAPIDAAPGVAAAPMGMPTTYVLQAGQELQFTQAAALDGTIIQADNPIGVWGGKTLLAIDACCDESSHQQIPPVRALGSEYVAVRYRNRYEGTEESPPWRIIGAANGTQLTYDPKTPPGAPTTLSLGQVETFSFNGPFVVKSQDAKHPFYMSAHMTGGALYDPGELPDGGMTNLPGDGRGDAEFVNIVPPGEYLQSYVFFTDPTYPETDLVFVRVKGPQGFADVKLDCAGTLSGWQPVDTADTYEYTRFDLVTGNFVGTGSCDNGRHEVTSTAPVGLTVWGWGSAATGELGTAGAFYSQYVSYAYPAGAGVAPINTVVIPAVPQ